MIIEHKLYKTRHFGIRSQQRGISQKNVDLLLSLGPKYFTTKPGYDGITKRIFCKKSILRALKEKKILPAQFDKLSGICILIKNNDLITAYHL